MSLGGCKRVFYFYSRRENHLIQDPTSLPPSATDNLFSLTIESIINKEDGLMQKIYNAIDIYGDPPKRQNKPRTMLSYAHSTNQKYIQHGQLTRVNYTENK